MLQHQQSNNCAMMGLQATTGVGVTGKRKLEAATTPADSSTPAKNGRWEAEDCIARLQAVAVPTADAWRAPTPSLAATLLTTTDDEFDDDDFDDELSDDEKCSTSLTPSTTSVNVMMPEPARYTQQPPYNR